jgi:microtubule-associated protein-like 6
MGRLLTFTPGGKPPMIKSISYRPGSLLLGTSSSQIFELTLPNLESNVHSDILNVDGSHLTIVMQGHCSSRSLNTCSSDRNCHHEAWGLAMHPSSHQYVSCGDDGTLRVWDIDHRTCVSLRTLPCASRCAAYTPDGLWFAVGCTDGSVHVLNSSTLAEVALAKYRTAGINEVKFSPDGSTLAVACHITIDMYSVEEGSGNLKRKGVCKGHEGSVSHFDWSADGKHMQSTSVTGELLFWDILESPPPSGHPLIKPSKVCDADWRSISCVLGWSVQGIMPADGSVTDIHCCEAAHGGSVIAAGVFTDVRLFHYPCVYETFETSRHRAHGKNAINIRWSCDDEYVVSTGGADLTICQWRHVETPKHAETLDGNTNTVSAEHIAFEGRVEAAIYIQRSYRRHKVHKELAELADRRAWLLRTLNEPV